MSNARYLDMTTGSGVKEILRFALPLLVGTLFQQVYSVVDTMVAGHTLGDLAIAAIGTTIGLYSLIINFSVGLNRGFALVLTQRYGAKDREAIQSAIATMILLNVIVAVFLTVLACLFMPQLLRLVNTPEEIWRDSYTYTIIIAGGMGATIAFNLFSSILNAFGNSRTSNLYLVLSSALNIVLDILFVAVFHWGVGGAAAATILAAFLSALLSGLYFFRFYREVLPERRHWKLQWRQVSGMLEMGLGMALMISIVDIGTMTFQSANNNLGTLYITAHTAARKLIILAMSPQPCLYMGLATLVGQCWGAGNKKRIKEYIPKGLALVEAWEFLAILLIFTLGAPLIRLMTGTSDQQVLRYAVFSIRVNVILFPLCGYLCTMRTVLQAMGVKKETVFCSIIELLMKTTAAFLLVPRIGFLGTCITEPIVWVVCSLYILSVYYAKRKPLGIF